MSFDISKALRNHGISKREVEILSLVVKGESNLEIAQKLCITESAIKSHLSNIYRKLGVKSRAQAIVRLLEARKDFEYDKQVRAKKAMAGDGTLATPPICHRCGAFALGILTTEQELRNEKEITNEHS